MGHPSMAICVLVTLALPRLICGRPATDDDGSVFNMLESRVSKPKDFSEPKAISSLIEQDLSNSKSRQRRLSDQRRAELETLVTLSKICPQLLTRQTNERLDPMRIGRRRRFTVDQLAPIELVTAKMEHTGDPAYPLIS